MSEPRRQKHLVEVFPFWGYGSVLTAVLGVIACITILIFVNDKEADQGSWKLSPNVLLSICVAIINISLHLAHTEGLNVVWWRRAQAKQGNPHLLHESWERADSLFMAVASVHRFDVISLATIFVALAPIAGPFLQRAVKVVPDYVSDNSTTIEFPMADQLPTGFSGYTSAKDKMPSLMSWLSVSAMYDYQLNNNITISNMTGCDGSCSTTIRAAGFDVTCKNASIPLNFPTADSQNGTAQVFGTDILFDPSEPNIIRLNTLWKDDDDCSGVAWVNNCTLTASTIDFPIDIVRLDYDANTTTGSGTAAAVVDYYSGFYDDLNDTTGINNFPVKVTNAVHTNLDADSEQKGVTTIGGVWMALRTQFASTAKVSYLDGYGYDMNFDGTLSSSYLYSNDSVLANASQDVCGLQFSDPFREIIIAAQDLMIRLASKATDQNSVDNPVLTKQTVHNVAEVRNISKYKSNFKYMGAALVFSCLGIIFVAPLLHGFWQLKSWGTMSPLETAKYISEAHLTPVSTSHGSSEDGKGRLVVNEREVKMS